MAWLNELEVGLLRSLHDLISCKALDWFFPLITKLGNAGIFCIILAVALLIFKKTPCPGVRRSFAGTYAHRCRTRLFIPLRSHRSFC